MTDTITIGSHEYGVVVDALIAERYEDEVELRIGPMTSGSLGQPLRAWYVISGPRGGLRSAYQSFTDEEAGEFALRLMDARRHLRVLDTYRKERWG